VRRFAGSQTFDSLRLSRRRGRSPRSPGAVGADHPLREVNVEMAVLPASVRGDENPGKSRDSSENDDFPHRAANSRGRGRYARPPLGQFAPALWVWRAVFWSRRRQTRRPGSVGRPASSSRTSASRSGDSTGAARIGVYDAAAAAPFFVGAAA
jgi:hypothetical protein